MSARGLVLFLCTGNYYRSRFAELLFNHLADGAQLPFTADSAGLAPACFHRNPGPVSRHTLEGLRARGIEPPASPRSPRDVTTEDFTRAALVIALKESEHRPLLDERFPLWTPRVRFWHIDDVQDAPPSAALLELEANVVALATSLLAGPSGATDGLPDVRDGLTRLERAIVAELHRARQELGRESIPTTMLYGRVAERIDVGVPEFQRALQRLVGGPAGARRRGPVSGC